MEQGGFCFDFLPLSSHGEAVEIVVTRKVAVEVVSEGGVAEGRIRNTPPETLYAEGLPYVIVDGEWLIAISPLARRLGIMQADAIVRRIPKEWVRKATIQTKGGPQLVWCATWDGFGVIVQRSDKAEAFDLQNRMASLLGREIRQKLGIEQPRVAPISSGFDVAQLVKEIVTGLAGLLRPDLIVDTNDRVQRIEGASYQTLSVVKTFADRLPVQRKGLEIDTKETHRHACARFTGGCCPRCRLATIIDDSGKWIPGAYEFDHWYRRDLNAADQTWPLCMSCHDAVTLDAGLRTAWVHNWRTYLELIEYVEQPLLTGTK